MKRTLFYIAAFVLIFISSIIILHHNGIQPKTTQQTPINSFITNAKVTEYNLKGEIKTTAHASEITHWETTDETHFTNPDIMTYTDTDRTPWHIYAKNGVSNKDSTLVILTHDVVIHKLETPKHSEMTIKTSELNVFPKESRVTTDQSVVLAQPGTVIHGVGFSANLKTGEYKLRRGTSATFDPQKQPKNN